MVIYTNQDKTALVAVTAVVGSVRNQGYAAGPDPRHTPDLREAETCARPRLTRGRGAGAAARWALPARSAADGHAMGEAHDCAAESRPATPNAQLRRHLGLA